MDETLRKAVISELLGEVEDLKDQISKIKDDVRYQISFLLKGNEIKGGVKWGVSIFEFDPDENKVWGSVESKDNAELFEIDLN